MIKVKVTLRQKQVVDVNTAKQRKPVEIAAAVNLVAIKLENPNIEFGIIHTN